MGLLRRSRRTVWRFVPAVRTGLPVGAGSRPPPEDNKTLRDTDHVKETGIERLNIARSETRSAAGV